jgi:hypothetical protein
MIQAHGVVSRRLTHGAERQRAAKLISVKLGDFVYADLGLTGQQMK